MKEKINYQTKRRKNKMKRGLTFTVIAQAQSLNYGEGIGNISELKN